MSWHVWRDIAIVTFALLAGAYEITVGGGRPSVLTFLSGLLLSPIVIRADENRRINRPRADKEESVP